MVPSLGPEKDASFFFSSSSFPAVSSSPLAPPVSARLRHSQQSVRSVLDTYTRVLDTDASVLDTHTRVLDTAT